ncbi:TonB-dependent receptor [Longitalea arenae]|uniref:TonB-dependent receptor n=1 Tax=Longitalea arenae TaxID=2812558 RepID=UPI001966FD61|nr:TonB-dependent receptor [Longitalea arenae]
MALCLCPVLTAVKKTAALFVVLFLLSFPVFSQHAAIKGTVIDTLEKRNLSNTVIALLRPADSVLVSFTRSNKDGNFSMQNLSPGKFIVLMTRPAYADYYDRIEITAGGTLDLGKISMILKSQLLQEVVVQHKLGAIRIKGDTTEYIADSFKLSAGATVEDLLKKLPGIQVDKDGKITAQGETVQKVLVDGEEFFSDDPTIATRGLTADAVEKVQSFDKKSDQATFTGIDDGEKTKTINLQLKEDKKRGYFGKLEAGSDGDRFWNNNLMLNAFKGKRKLSAFGIMSNTGKTGLDWQEGMNYGANNVEMGDDGAGGTYVYIDGGDDEFGSGNYWGEGLPKGWSAGLHYSNKWNADKIHLNSGYQYNKLNTEARGNTFSQYIVNDSTNLFVNETGNSFRSRDRNRINGLYEIKIDSFSSVKITAQGSIGNNYSHNIYRKESLNDNYDTLSIIDRETTVDANNKNFNSSLLWKQRFKKAGRTLSVSARQHYTENAASGIYASDNYFFSNGRLDSLKVLDQHKRTDNITSAINARATYTEPLSKRALLEFNYSIDNNHRQSRISTREKANPNLKEYDQYIDSLSNDYSFNVLTQSGGINYRYAKPKKISFSFGMNISNAVFTRKDLKADSAIDYSFTNFYPQANLVWTMGSNGNLRFNYNGSTQAPSIDQIQPIQDITDQLNIRSGNPDLEQAFRHNFSVTYNSYKFLSERSIYANLNFTAIQNDFSTRNLLDTRTGRNIAIPVNVDGNYRANGWFGYWQKIKKWNIRTGFNGRFNINHNTNFIRDQENENDSYTFGGGPRIGYDKEKKFELWIGTGFYRNISKTSLSSGQVTRYWTQEHNVDLLVFLPWKLEIGTNCNFNFRQKTSTFDRNNNSIRWNARLDRKLFKNNVARIRFSANDILDQNIGFNRNINSNFISERTYDTIRRYFMLTFIWNFSKNGKPAEW